jgi:hypothetical protein
MSRSNAPKQATLNEWVNAEAVEHYARGLEQQANVIESWSWQDGEPEQETAIEALRGAAAAVRGALALARPAERLSSDEYAERIYHFRRDRRTAAATAGGNQR